MSILTRRFPALSALLLAAAASAPASASAPQVRVGVGRADITPITGVFKGGWACTCAKAVGQHERLYARVVVIQEGRQKVALVTEDLFALSAGMIRDAATLLPGRGFSEQNIIDSATHTHSSQSGYMNFSSYNSILPSNSNPTFSGITNTNADPVMYSFMTHELARAIRRADDDLRPGAIGWGQSRLLGITQNRSLGAHLANYGITSGGANGGSPHQDPGGYADTIDPAVNVLRIDQDWPTAHPHRGAAAGKHMRAGKVRRVPVGIYATFANHGTVDHANFSYYSADHQGAAERVVEDTIRADGRVPKRQPVINAFANSDAGDMTSGIRFVGPAAAEYVGRAEARAMLEAWRQAGRRMTTHPAFALRFTRVCMCGQQTSAGVTDSTPWIGQAAGAGSEEGRTIFYYDGVANEGDKLPFDSGPQGDKVTVLNEKGNVPQAVPFTVLRLGDRLLATVPGEPTASVGKMIRGAVLAAVGRAGIRTVVIVGYTGDYLSYFTTPPQYEQQAYEGGFTLYGHYSSLVLRDTLVGLSRRMTGGRPAPPLYPYDPNHGVHVSGPGYGAGSANGTVTGQPGPARRLGHTAFSWRGGAQGIDRPVDRPFVAVQRDSRNRWATVTDDLGMQILWSSDASGDYRAQWEVPLSAPPGRYRFVVTAKRYRLISRPFAVRVGAILIPTTASATTLELRYPQPFLLNDWTYRPTSASGGAITFLVGRRRVVVREQSSSRFPIPRGTRISIPAGGAHDRNGNRNASAVRVR